VARRGRAAGRGRETSPHITIPDQGLEGRTARDKGPRHTAALYCAVQPRTRVSAIGHARDVFGVNSATRCCACTHGVTGRLRSRVTPVRGCRVVRMRAPIWAARTSAEGEPSAVRAVPFRERVICVPVREAKAGEAGAGSRGTLGTEGAPREPLLRAPPRERPLGTWSRAQGM